MARKTIKQKAIEHYDRMIEWAKTQQNKNKPDMWDMHYHIKECYGAQDCPYCEKYGIDCEQCKLQGKEPDPEYCCGGLYEKICYAKTWKLWIKHAEKVKQYIIDNG